jgi:hypothetical protein
VQYSARAQAAQLKAELGEHDMGIFDSLSEEFIDVIHRTDDTRDTRVWRFDRAGHQTN